MKVQGELFFFLDAAANTSNFIVYDGLIFRTFGTSTAGMDTVDVIENNGRYYVTDASSRIYSATSKTSALTNWNSATASNTTLRATPGVYGTTGNISLYLCKGQSGEVFGFTTNASKIVQADDGIFYFTVSGGSTAGAASVPLTAIVGDSYVYVFGNGASQYVYYLRDALTAAYPEMFGGFLSNRSTPSATPNYRRIA
jgi:hypothetical protein